MIGYGRLFALCAVLATLAGCDWFSSKAPEAPRLRVVNVLSKDMYNDAHIKGSEHIDFTQVKDAAKTWNKADTIVFYCSNFQCTASGSAATQLKEMGFGNVFAYEGGTAEWKQLGFEIEGPAQGEYLTMVVEKPATHAEGVMIITAPELKAKMEEAGLLTKVPQP